MNIVRYGFISCRNRLYHNIKQYNKICNKNNQIYFTHTILNKSFTSATKTKTDYSKLTYYEILGISTTATQKDIKRKFLELAKIYHPDVYKGTDHEKFKHIREAYEILRNPQKRKEYDRKINTDENTTDDLRYETKPDQEGQESGRKSNNFDDIKIDEEIDIDKEFEEFMKKPIELNPDEVVVQEHAFLQSLSKEERMRYEMTHIMNNSELHFIKYAHRLNYDEILNDNIKRLNEGAETSDAVKEYKQKEEIKSIEKKYKIIKIIMIVVVVPFLMMTIHKRFLIKERKRKEEEKLKKFIDEMELKQVQDRLVF